MKSIITYYHTILAICLIVFCSTSYAQVSLTNGSFEDTGDALAVSGLYQASGWINLSTPGFLQIQASSCPMGFLTEQVYTGHGNRYLRLVDDVGQIRPQNIGYIAQCLGTMTEGEVYTLTGDAFNTVSTHYTVNPYKAVINFVDAPTKTANVLASTSVNITSPGGSQNFELSYTAISSDHGQNLYVRLDAVPQPNGRVTRGGFDNLQLSAVLPILTPNDILNDIISRINLLLANPGVPAAAKTHLANGKNEAGEAIIDFDNHDAREAFKDLEDLMEDLMPAADDGADVAELIDLVMQLGNQIVADLLAEANQYAGAAIVDGYIANGLSFISDSETELANGEPDQAIRRLGSARTELSWAIQTGSAISQGMDAKSNVNEIIVDIQDLIDNGGFSTAADADLQDAIDELADVISDFNNDGDIDAAYADLQDAVEQLQDAEADGAIATNEISTIVNLAKMLAEVKLNEAQAFADNPDTDDRIAEAQAAIADGDNDVSAGDEDKAISDYRAAWNDARIALEHARGLRKVGNDISDGTTELIPDHFILEQNYPNPFNPSTTIRFALPAANTVTLKIYNVAGQLVNTLVNNAMSAGYHQVNWNGQTYNGQSVASGLYFYHISAGDFQQVKKMMLIK